MATAATQPRRRRSRHRTGRGRVGRSSAAGRPDPARLARPGAGSPPRRPSWPTAVVSRWNGAQAHADTSLTHCIRCEVGKGRGCPPGRRKRSTFGLGTRARFRSRTRRVPHDGLGLLGRRRRRTRTSVVAIAARAIPPTTRRSPTLGPGTAVIDGIVVRQCTDHERALLPPIARRQLRLKIRPLSAGLGHRPGHGLREVVLDHAARRRRVRGLPGLGVDQPPVLVERGMGDPQRAFAHAGNLVLHHEAAGREIGGHARRRRAAEVEHRTGPGLVQPRRVVVSDRPGRVGLIGPVAVRVEVLGSVQGPPESLHGQALGAVFRVPVGPAGRLQVHRARVHLALVVEQPLGSFHAFCEPRAHVVHAGHQRIGGLVAGTRIPALEEVGVVAMRRRVRQLVTVGRPDGPELTVVSGEIVDGSRREAGRIRTRLTGTGQGGPGDAFVLAALAAGVDGAERGRRARRRPDERHHDQAGQQPPPPSPHRTASRRAPRHQPPMTVPRSAVTIWTAHPNPTPRATSPHHADRVKREPPVLGLPAQEP